MWQTEVSGTKGHRSYVSRATPSPLFPEISNKTQEEGEECPRRAAARLRLASIIAIAPLYTESTYTDGERVGHVRPLSDLNRYPIQTHGNLGPYAIDADVWASYFDDDDDDDGETPAYSAYYPLVGPNVSEPYPGSLVDGWSVSVAVRDNIPLTNASLLRLAGGASDRDKFIAGVRVTLNPPAALLEDEDEGDDDDESKETRANWAMDPSWRLCYSHLTFPSTQSGATQARLADDDGSCSSLWNETCLAAIEVARTGIIAFGAANAGSARESRPTVRIVCPRAKEEGEAEIEAEVEGNGGAAATAGVGKVALVLCLAVGVAFCLG
ncbi:hypothetical protein CTA1_1008 [Colletotrichum tanaceti]|uniref:Uncharacterized protein n=1 Tax=Colletotrichum tanaceti TaxID=1306861 RepID=A0A4U6XEM2_9PEZI|nr:hypothetical protein CTA1_1008 [Colletotrichum tanaceti]